MKLFILMTMFLFGALTVQANSFSVGQPRLVGGGCPPGTARAAVLDDGSTISILFDNFLTSAKPGYFPPAKTAKKCNFRIPVQIPQGYSLLPLNILYSGFAKVSGRTTATVATTGPLITIGSKSATRPPITSVLQNVDGNFQVEQLINVAKPLACMKQDAIEFSTEIFLTGGAFPAKGPGFFSEESIIGIDAADIGNAFEPIRIQFQLAKCN